MGTRCFCAVPLPEGLRRKLAALQSDLAPVVPGTKWVQEENLHLTLAFFGDLGREQVVSVVDGISREMMGQFVTRVEVKGLGAFPSPGRARVLWVGMSHAEFFQQLSLAVWRGAASVALRETGPGFRPHVTLGRVREPCANEGLRRQLVDRAAEQWGTMDVDRVVLFASKLSPQGPSYSELGGWMLESQEMTPGRISP